MKIQYTIFIVLCMLFDLCIQAQQTNNPKVILITLDGFRWQELFSGADTKLIQNEEYVNSPKKLMSQFWFEDASERRKALLPFIWSEVPQMGQLHGNVNLGSNVNLTNSQLFSYPGYNEILTGRTDDERINSNDKVNNPNKTVLELINSNPKFKGKVAAFGSWDVFPYIINEERSGVPVNAGYELVEGGNLSKTEVLLNAMQEQTPKLWESVRLDAFTHNYALEYLKKERPDLLYISYGETDDFAHDGNYQDYLFSANRTDAMLRELWDFTKSDALYKDNTIFIITSDHGRGTIPLESWRHHGSDVKGAEQVWVIVFGNGVEALGEIDKNEQLYSTQIAPTILNLLGVPYDTSVIEFEGLSILED